MPQDQASRPTLSRSMNKTYRTRTQVFKPENIRGEPKISKKCPRCLACAVLLGVGLFVQGCSSLVLSGLKDRVPKYQKELGSYKTYGWVSTISQSTIYGEIISAVNAEMAAMGYSNIGIIVSFPEMEKPVDSTSSRKLKWQIGPTTPQKIDFYEYLAPDLRPEKAHDDSLSLRERVNPDLHIYLEEDLSITSGGSGGYMTPDGSYVPGISVPIVRKIIRIRIQDPRLSKPLREGTFTSGEGLSTVEKRFLTNPDEVRVEIANAAKKLLRKFPHASE